MTDYKKLYEEALERAKYWAEGKCVEDFDDSPQNVLNFVFPEAKESEDEKIRKFLIKCVQQPMGTDLLNGIKKDDVIAWLEKRGEQKPTDKVEPKFKVGDWGIDNEDDTIFQIVKVLDSTYKYKTNEGDEYYCAHYSLEDDARLWTIQDAKDGDVLADDYSIIIFRKIGNESWSDVIDFYVGYNHDSNKFNIQSGKSHYGNTNTTSFKPATKEQRDFLFTKMKENGYEWDAEDKVLGKIEQKSTWSEEDDRNFRSIRCYLNEFGNWLSSKNEEKSLSVYKACDWLKSLKERMALTNKNDFDRGYDVGISAAKFNQWKPTEEQMEALADAIESYCGTCRSTLNSLYNNLKKL